MPLWDYLTLTLYGCSDDDIKPDSDAFILRIKTDEDFFGYIIELDDDQFMIYLDEDFSVQYNFNVDWGMVIRIWE